MNWVIHYHEIALKGDNRRFFIKALQKNIRRSLQDLGRLKVARIPGRILVSLDTDREQDVQYRLALLPGIANFSRTHAVKPEVNRAAHKAWELIAHYKRCSFRVTCKRSYKQFPFTSQEIAATAGAYILERARKSHRSFTVDLKQPDVTIYMEVLRDKILVHHNKIKGPGGLPVGVSGKVLCLLSSGFDSPVAAYKMMTRGAQVILCHFHSYPYTDRASLDNARSIAGILSRYQHKSLFIPVPFFPVQQEIINLVPPDLRMIFYRRSMFRLAEKLALDNGAQALVTGESLGQVASQTLANLAVIDQAASLPVLRPLIGTNKDDIIQETQRIGTYIVSSQPYDDCCSLMLAPHPATKTDIQTVLQLENQLNLTEIENQILEETQIETICEPWPLHTRPEIAV